MATQATQVLKLSLHGQLVGHLLGYASGRNELVFAEEFKASDLRPTLSLITHPSFPNVNKLLAEPWARNQRLHPVLSNLLPEGSLRSYLAQSLKIHTDSEFQLLAHLGQDLPGALIATPVLQEENSGLANQLGEPKQENGSYNTSNQFSLAGVQMKFSMKEKDGCYTLATNKTLGDWIIKTPSSLHKNVPINEFSVMQLAALAGVEIPNIQLVELNKLENLPPINLPNESLAFAIQRFDRQADTRIHTEDFAQILVKYPHEKYDSANYEQLARIIYNFSSQGLADVQQFARRLLINILLANGDAHLKNWSLFYPDTRNPKLAPAYDLLTTSLYINNEHTFALNLAKNKNWYKTSFASFEYWANKAGIPWRAIKPHLDDTLNLVKSLWRKELNNLPMTKEHQQHLKMHWRLLHPDFQI